MEITGRGVAIKDIKKFSSCPCTHAKSINFNDEKNSKNIFIKDVEIYDLKANITQSFLFKYQDEKVFLKGCFGEILRLDLVIDKDGYYWKYNFRLSNIIALIKQKFDNLLPSNTLKIPD